MHALLGQYFYQLKSTKEQANVDSLSHLPVEEANDPHVVDATFKVSFVNDLSLTAVDIATTTAKGPILTQMYQYLLEGWPQTGAMDDLRAFYQQKNHLCTDQGCVL